MEAAAEARADARPTAVGKWKAVGVELLAHAGQKQVASLRKIVGAQQRGAGKLVELDHMLLELASLFRILAVLSDDRVEAFEILLHDVEHALLVLHRDRH